ncbi:MAG: hypothetical protein HYX63_01525 [Gammaproteobacteria bacterium]|nr:hypothetical protein [Gammaproteobacteria bacterium]
MQRIESPLIDWVEVLSKIRARGYSYQQIADRIGVSHNTVAWWGQGYMRDVRHSNGVKLLALLDSIATSPVQQFPQGIPHGASKITDAD